MKIIAHCLVKNEEKFIWYAINSVLNSLDGILIYLDDRSDDQTESIIKTIKSSKIVFKKKSPRNLQELGNLRQEMLEETKADWIFILDGDEIWHSDTIAGLRSKIYDLKDEKDLIVSPNYMLIGDMFHFQPEEAGKYRIANRQGNYNVRFIRKGIPGLHAEGAFLHEGYADGRGIKIQDLEEERIYFSNDKYLHASFLPRSLRGNEAPSTLRSGYLLPTLRRERNPSEAKDSSLSSTGLRPRYFAKGDKKPKFEIGKEFPKDFYYPEVFFKPRPNIVPSPWRPMTKGYKLRAFIETPIKKLKRRLI